ncbi:MAG: hypothetical protein ACFHX7_00730 [Pseudomonadota bacterium]
MSDTATAKLTDGERFRRVGAWHGLAFLGAITLFGAADAWAIQTDLAIAHIVSVINAVVAASILSILMHEWGHFTGARLSGAYSPLVQTPTSQFIFGFRFDRNTREQFLAMSLGGLAGSWLLVAIILLAVPLDNWGRVTLFAVAVARAISATLFEAPIVHRAWRGGDPQAELNEGLANGSGDRGQVLGYSIGAVIWLIAI